MQILKLMAEAYSTQTEEQEVTAIAECLCDSCLEYSYPPVEADPESG